MATVQAAIVNRALRLLGQLSSGASPSTDESNDALTALNSMIDGWNLNRSMVYSMREESVTLSDGTASYTIGSDGSPTLNTTRPVEIYQAWIVDSNTSYEVKPMTEEEYALIPDKTTESDWPEYFLHRTTYPNATLIVYPVPNATRTLKIMTRTPLAALALADTLSAPRGYERAFAYNLAVEIAPEYEVEPSPRVLTIAKVSRADVMRQATPPVAASSDVYLLARRGASNILADN
jgi:hypothetical protein